MQRAFLSAIKHPINAMINKWVQYFGFAGISTSGVIHAAERISGRPLEPELEFMGHAIRVVDWAGAISIVAGLVLIASHVMLFRVRRLEAKIKQKELERMEKEEAAQQQPTQDL